MPKDPQPCKLEKIGKWVFIQTNVTGNKIRSNLRQPSMVIFTCHLKNKYLGLAIRQDLKMEKTCKQRPTRIPIKRLAFYYARRNLFLKRRSFKLSPSLECVCNAWDPYKKRRNQSTRNDPSQLSLVRLQ